MLEGLIFRKEVSLQKMYFAIFKVFVFAVTTLNIF